MTIAVFVVILMFTAQQSVLSCECNRVQKSEFHRNKRDGTGHRRHGCRTVCCRCGMLQWRFPMMKRRMSTDSVSEDRFRLAFVAVVKKSGFYQESTSIRTTCFAIRSHIFRRFRPSNRYHNRVSIYVVGNEPGCLTDLIITANRVSYLFFMSAYSKTPPRD